MHTSEVFFSSQRAGDVSSLSPTLDPTWETVTTLFPGQTGMKILLAILASAEIIQQTLPTWGLIDVAILNCRNLASFAQQVGCGKDTLLRYVKIYQTLGLLTHARAGRQRSTTELTLPLTPYRPSSEILERLNTLVSQGRQKQQALARFVRDRYILLYRLPQRSPRETQVTEHPISGLLTRTAHLLQKKRVRRIERQLLHEEITEILAQMEVAQPGDSFSLWNEPGVHQEDRLAAEIERGDRRYGPGDLSSFVVTRSGDLLQDIRDVHAEVLLQPGDVWQERGDRQRGAHKPSGDRLQEMGDPHAQVSQRPGDLTPYRGDFSSHPDTKMGDVGDRLQDSGDLTLPIGDVSAHIDTKTVPMGDLKDVGTAPSSIDSVFRQKDSSQNEFELESPVDEPWIGSEEELSLEAARYLTLLDGPDYATPEYLNTHAGKKALGGYKNKILRSPQLARLAAINTLLQGTFYDLTKQKKPLESPGRWFHSSFDRYADPVRPMEIMGEILDWAKSPYTLEEIALVLPLERQRQEVQWYQPEPLHFPFASCVAQHHQVSDIVSDPQRSHSEENRHESSLAGTPMKIDGRLRLSAFQGMSASEAELVATEMRQETSWYLYDIHVRASQEGENASVVEAYLVDSVFLVTYHTRQEWWLHHQEQLWHEEWQQKRKGGSRRASRTSALQ